MPGAGKPSDFWRRGEAQRIQRGWTAFNCEPRIGDVVSADAGKFSGTFLRFGGDRSTPVSISAGDERDCDGGDSVCGRRKQFRLLLRRRCCAPEWDMAGRSVDEEAGRRADGRGGEA